MKNKNEITLWQPPPPPPPGFSRKRVGLAGNFAAILEHSGQLKKPGLELLQNPGCLGEIMTQTKKRKKGIETVRGYKMSKRVYRSAVKSVLLSVIGSIFLQPIWRGNVNFMRRFFFLTVENSARPRSRINSALYAPRRELWLSRKKFFAPRRESWLPWKRWFPARRRNDPW